MSNRDNDHKKWAMETLLEVSENSKVKIDASILEAVYDLAEENYDKSDLTEKLDNLIEQNLGKL